MRLVTQITAPLALALWLTGSVLCVTASPVEAQDAAVLETSRIGATRMIEVEGREMRAWTAGLEDRAPGEPVVVFESGLNPMRAWSAVLHDVAHFAPVVAYDRAGRGWSEWDGMAPTPEHVTRKLRGLLRAVGAEPPYVLVGMDWGAPLALAYTERHPQDVEGMVLLDPWPVPAPVRRALQEAGLRGKDAEAYGDLLRTKAETWPAGERRDVEVAADWLSRAGNFPPAPDVPLSVLVASLQETPPDNTESTPWDDEIFREAELQHRIRWLSEWALGSPEGTFVATNASSGYPVALGEPARAVRAIRSVIFPDITRQILSAIEEEGVEAAIRIYLSLRQRYPADRFDSHLLMRPGYQLLGKETDAAVRLFEINVQEYPEDPYAHFALGEAYATANRLLEARRHLETAVRLGEQLGDSALPEFRAALASVEARLGAKR